MAYDDGRVACTDQDLVIRGYYFPAGAKHIPYGRIRTVRRTSLTDLGRWRTKVWGSGDLAHWFNLDPHRFRKDTAFVVELGRPVRPVVTPDDPDRVAAELTAHGVNVTGG
jgi:hypothetical protein